MTEDNAGVDVQDNSREKAMAELLGLSTTGKRNGFDAVDSSGNPYELKTTSVRDVGTGRDVGRVWIEKIRAGYFIAAKTDMTIKSEWKPSEVIFRTELFKVSATYKLPKASITIAEGP